MKDNTLIPTARLPVSLTQGLRHNVCCGGLILIPRSVLESRAQTTLETTMKDNLLIPTYIIGYKLVSSMCPSPCPVSPVKTGQDMEFSGHIEHALGRVLGHVPGHAKKSSLGACVPRGLVQLCPKIPCLD